MDLDLMTAAARDAGPMLDPVEELQLALDVAAVPPRELDGRLHPYQVQAVQHLHRHPHAGLFLVPGLGKSAVVLQALTEEHLPALVIAPKRVAEETWPVEVPKWRDDLSYTLIRGNGVQRRRELLEEQTDIHIISRDTFWSDITKKKLSSYRTVVLDELSSFKNRQSKRWRHAKSLVRDVPYVWGLTGTPTPNGLLDLWPQLFLLDRGARLGRTVTSYRSRYFTPGLRLPNGVITGWNLRPGAEEEIWSKIGDLCLSVDRAHADYPIQNDVYHRFALDKASEQAYVRMAQEFVAEVAGSLASVENSAAKTGKLSQIASGFMYHSGLIGAEESDEARVTQHHDTKLRLTREILEDAQGSPALVFYRFNEDRKRLLSLEGAVDVKVPGSVERWNAGEIPVLVAHPASAGHGLNLQKGGHLMIWYGLTWSSEEYVQGIGRLVRQGQTAPAVAVHHLVAADTVDEQMIAVVQGKISRQDALLKVLERGKTDD